MKNKPSKLKIMKTIALCLWIIFIMLNVIESTNARYSTLGQGTAKIETAKWAVKVTNNTNTLQNNFVLNFTVDENLDVVDGKIAPNTSASAQIILDLTGTEVYVDYAVSIDQANINSLFGESASTATLNTSISGAGSGTSGIIALPNGESFTSSNGKVIIDLTLTWENNESFNISDTAVGIFAETLQIPVNLTIKQHISES